MNQQFPSKEEYLQQFKDRKKTSRIYVKYQLTGLMIAGILGDNEHKALYIRLAKKYDERKLIELARNIAEKKNVLNKGAYFMSMLKENKKWLEK